jgi:DNA-binding response OmpR family regulator
MTNALRGPSLSVLIADDDPAILNIVSKILQLQGFFAYTCADGDSAVKLFEELQPRLVILDVRMPAADGLTACKRIRAVSDVPIIMLTVMDDQKDVARALEAGADDYVRKPFGADELLARVNAVLRRSRVAMLAAEILEAGPLTLDCARRIARVGDTELTLTATEFILLAYLIRHRDRVLTHEQILEAIWGPEYTDSRHMLRVTMSRLRRKVDMPPWRRLIETLPRVGYRLHAAERQAA